MTKAEMAEHAAQCRALTAEARGARQKGQHAEAIRLALAACAYVDGMMQYARRYEDAEIDSVEAIDIILACAPLIFHTEGLDAVCALLKEQRRVERNTAADMGERLEKAQELMGDAYRLWKHLEQHPGMRQDQLRETLGGEQGRWRRLAEEWEEMGIVRREAEGGSYRLTLTVSLDDVVKGKCSECGAVCEDAKVAFLRERACARCGQAAWFVILVPEAAGARA